jgi:glutathione reductase (NADPH)
LTMTQQYDVIVLGSGSAGYTVASKCRAAGMAVALVESREYGGTCPLRGCNPKKVLVNAAEIVRRSQDMRGKGIQAAAAINWPDLIAFKRTLIEPMPESVARRLQKSGVDTYREQGHFLDRDSIQAGDRVLRGSTIFVGTGAVPRRLAIPGGELAISSERFLNLERLPQRIVFIGGGYISFEFAFIAAVAGAKPVILHRSGRPLKNFDPDLVDKLAQYAARMGIDLRVNMPVHGVQRRGPEMVVNAGRDADQELVCDLVVHGAGRVAHIADLDLEKAGVEASDRGIAVNEYLQSRSNPRVYAGGDAAATPYPLTPTAYLHGRIAAQNIINGNKAKVNHAGIPRVVFTVPPLAAAGLGEAEARNQGLEFETVFRDTSGWFSSKSIGLEQSWAKILVEKQTGSILGAHLLANHAEETINVFALAIRLGLTLNNLKEVVWAYPTSISDIAYLL